MAGRPGVSASATPAITSTIEGAVLSRRAITAAMASTARNKSRIWMVAVMPDDHSALAAMLTVSASSAALKMKEMMLWANTVRRIGLQLTVTSETCAHMPMTKEK